MKSKQIEECLISISAKASHLLTKEESMAMTYVIASLEGGEEDSSE